MIDRDALAVMEAFVAVVDRGSLAAAARVLGVTPSAVSKQIARLERRLRVRLLQRTTRSLRVTAAGERYRAHARKVIAALEEAEADVQAGDAVLAGALRVSAPTLLGEELVAPIAARFLKEHPDVRLELELTDRFVDVVSEPIDLAVRVAPRLPESGLLARRIGDLTWVLVASPAYLRERGEPATPRDLTEHRCLELAHGSDRGHWRLEHRGRPFELGVRGPLVCTSLVALRRCAREGLGIVQLPAYIAREDIQRGRLVQVLPGVTGARRTVYVVQPTRAFVAPRVRAFVERIASELPSAIKSPPTRRRS
ncbi:MAG: Transcriptional regulator, LysR family protein [Labilithrix sp.]|nr:Transcriptional regulator, LysR family protein [Labilithrix sp.]